jgi:hypothetical protein
LTNERTLTDSLTTSLHIALKEIEILKEKLNEQKNLHN